MVTEDVPATRMEGQDQIIQEVLVGDDVLDDPPEGDVPVWCGAEVSDNAKACAALGPALRVFDKTKEADLHVEIEKGLVIMRWDQMNHEQLKESDMEIENRVDVHADEDEQIDPMMKEIIYNKFIKKFDAALKRPSYFPKNRRVFLPDPTEHKLEANMQQTKAVLMSEVRKYIKEECNESNIPKDGVNMD